jgi:hypothetical protein
METSVYRSGKVRKTTLVANHNQYLGEFFASIGLNTAPNIGRVDPILLLPNGKLEGGADRTCSDDEARGY